MSTKIPYYLYMSLRKAADQVGLSVQQTLDLTRIAREDGFELDFTPPPADYQRPATTAPQPTSVVSTPGAPPAGYSDRRAKEIISTWIAKLPSGARFTRDEVIRKALSLEPRDNLLVAHPTRRGALTTITNILCACPGVSMVTNEQGHATFADPEFTLTKRVA